jgi:hypothetical protein
MKQQKAKPARPIASSTCKSKPSSRGRSSQRRVSTPDVSSAAAPPGSVTMVQHGGARREESTPTSEVRAVRRIDAASAAEYQRMYAAAWTADAEGRLQLDLQQFAQALADALVDPLIEQDVYSRALLAAAEGHSSLLEEEPIPSEMKAAS